MADPDVTAPPASDADPLVGRELDGRYCVLSRLGSGGMGRVYLAEQKGLDRQVAIKVLTVEGDDTERFRERFFREARLSSKLKHPNTVRIFDYGRTGDGIFYIVMEYIEGATLGALLRREGALEPLRAVSLAMQVCGSLAEAHDLGVVHRDLKPDNLMVTRTADGKEFLKVLDFGIAKDTTSADLPTQTGTVLGSPAYMAPEQILEQELTPRADIYSVGAVLYRALTLRQPHGEANAIASMARHVFADVVPFKVARPDLSISPAIEKVVVTCLEKKAADRFVNVHELARALRIVELELRGMLPVGDLRVTGGRVVLPPDVDAQFSRIEGPTGASRPSLPAGDLVPSEPSQSLSTRLRHPAVIVLGGMVPVVGLGAAMLGLVALGAFVAIVWTSQSSGRSVIADPTPIVAPPAGSVPVPRADPPDPAPSEPTAAGSAPTEPAGGSTEPAGGAGTATGGRADPPPAGAEPPRPRPEPRPTSARPQPTPPAPPEPAPEPRPAAPAPAPDPLKADDLRNPFK